MSQANQEAPTNDNQKPKGDEPALCKYLHTTAKHQASDLHLKANSKPRIRLATQIRALTGETLSSQHIENLAFELINSSNNCWAAVFGKDQLERARSQHGQLSVRDSVWI